MNNKNNRPTIEEAKQIDMVSFLADLGFKPAKIARNDHWYFSPLRITERTPSFKIDKKKNLWYDHGLGKGGNLISFALLFYQCTIPEFLDSLAGKIHLSVPSHTSPGNIIPPQEPEHHSIQVTAVRPLFNATLIRYLQQRRIPLHIADQYCKEVYYAIEDKTYFGIGFKNDSDSFEIRNPYAKITCPPKDITTIARNANSVFVFEGFMDFLSFLTIHPQHPDFPKDYVILNSINQFEKARKFMEDHVFIHLFLDHDSIGRNYTAYACSISSNYQDESKLYKGYKDLNEWHVQFGKRPT